MAIEALSTIRAYEVPPEAAEMRWLAHDLWARQAVGIIGGAPKSFKSWLALDLAVSVASGTPALGRFAVDEPGPVAAYLAEDALPLVRQRIAGICAHRRLALAELDLHLITAPALRLDLETDQQRLRALLEEQRPRLLVLDPLVRLHRLDENSAGEISNLLGFLREMQREFELAVVLVHHMSKRVRANLGQALRGSSDLHAWGDSNAYLVRQKKHLMLTLEHRSAQALDPFQIRLATHQDGVHLEVITDGLAQDSAPPTPLTERVRHALADAETPMPRVALREALRVNNQRLGDALKQLELNGLACRTGAGWTAPSPPVNDSPESRQLALV